ncbi:hypothetical protein [Holdemania massiliensis]|uniref:DUF4830 domain-containing protein n=1 Tax=Holdemania massiliensis TaxID=1468449 RepID=A0A6N7S6B7_9FIRM|nr:hypothetical protein [Holdemania massiliensis]MSA71325.1 hypothetical protein [Holdemania massiliensis]MSA89232.1 hypothetical protein [Holdemania massiliensis]MSB78405.1 hypothetical protein [Holdemania massiliensis]MSC33329.1 hypothetical protein [Holdemania massiliensis]MSC39307.1 hypothetical protein [Holdemania massiliensis]
MKKINILLAIISILLLTACSSQLTPEEIAANKKRSDVHNASFAALNVALVDDLGYKNLSVDLEEYGDLGQSGMFAYSKGTVKFKDGNKSYAAPFVLNYFYSDEQIITGFCLLKVDGVELINNCDNAMQERGITN